MSMLIAAALLVVCPPEVRSPGCQFHNIQEAVDRAADADTVLLKAGHYAPVSTRDVQYKDITVRGYVTVERKRLTIVAEKGAVLDGRTQLPATAIVVNHADVTLRSLEITGFRYAVEEDDIYDGHGVFVIDSTARIEHVRMSHLAKMGLTGRGDSRLTVSDLQILDGHMGIWLTETTRLSLRDSVIRNNDSCALGAYDDSRAQLSGSLFEDNRDDGLYTEQRAVISADHVRIVNNRPIGAHAINDSRISIQHSLLSGNAAPVGSQGNGAVTLDGR